MDTFGLDDCGEYVCSDTGCRTNPCANTTAAASSPSFSTFCMYGFDFVMEFVLGIRSNHEFGRGSHVEFWHAWYTRGLGRDGYCIV